MDEIDWIKGLKKILKLVSIITIVVFVIPFCGFVFFGIVINGHVIPTKDKQSLIILLGISVTPILMTVGMYIFMYIFNKIINPSRKIINFNVNYIRELPKDFSPAIISIVYDLKTDIYKDYLATVLSLSIKKYINIKKVNSEYKIEQGEEKDFSKLGRSEKYVLDVLLKQKEFEPTSFREEIIKEAQEKGLITNKKYKKKTEFVIISIITIIIGFITYKINKYLFCIIILLMLPPLNCIFMIERSKYGRGSKYKRTQQGKKTAQIFTGLKKYINEYTLIKDKDIDYIQILEYYIPYAVALDEADTIEEFIKCNEKYRDLIYNRKQTK